MAWADERDMAYIRLAGAGEELLKSIGYSRDVWARVFVGITLVFGAYYAAIGDLATLMPFVHHWPSWALAGFRLVSAGALLVIAVLIAKGVGWFRQRGGEIVQVRQLTRTWFPTGRESRIRTARQRIEGLSWPIFSATISGQWDFVLPFTGREWRLLASQVPHEAQQLRVLLAHPHSEPLRRRCEHEYGQDLATMQNRIVNSTHNLLAIPIAKIEVRWALRPINFHLLGGQNEAIFAPFADDLPGHDSPTLMVTSSSPWYEAITRWFEYEWELGLDSKAEMPWVERGIARRRAVFLDRDDTLIKDIAYFGIPEKEQIEVLPGRIEGLRRLDKAGYRLIMVSNQPAPGLGISSETELARLTQRVKNVFRAEGVLFDAIYYCTHNEKDGCTCRKPGTVLFRRAEKRFNLIMRECHFIGDSDADRGVGANLPELKTHILSSHYGFSDIVDEILEEG